MLHLVGHILEYFMLITAYTHTAMSSLTKDQCTYRPTKFVTN